MRTRDRNRLWPIALSIQDAATCLQIPRTKIYSAIKNGELECFQHAAHRRLLVSSIELWIRRYWKVVRSTVTERPPHNWTLDGKAPK
jgi:hypothetical protein